MHDTPTFSKTHADRILKRAAEIEGSEDHNPVSVEELRSIAGAAGFGPKAIDRAITEALRDGVVQEQKPEVKASGVIVTNLSTYRVIPIPLDSQLLIRAVRLFQPYRDGVTPVTIEEHRITWKDRAGIRFSVLSTGGTTEVRVFVSKHIRRKRKWIEWVNTAADKLEETIVLVGSTNRDVPSLPRP